MTLDLPPTPDLRELEKRLPKTAPTPIDPPESWPEDLSIHRFFINQHIESGVPCDEGSCCWHLRDVLSYMFPVAGGQTFWLNFIRSPADCPSYPNTHALALRNLGCLGISPHKEYPNHTERDPDFVITQGDRANGPYYLVALIVIAPTLNITPEDSDHLLGYARRLMHPDIAALGPSMTLLFIAGSIAWEWRRDEIQELLELGCVTEAYLRVRADKGRSWRTDSVKFLQVLAGVRNRFVEV